jgi:hypothetical protein
LFAQLTLAAAQARKNMAFISLGRLGSGEALWADLARRYGGDFVFLRLGEQPAERISECFNSLDFGVATTPLAILGKSASATAMLEHGLPLIVNRDEIPRAGPVAPTERDQSLILGMNASFVSRLANGPLRQPPASRLPVVVAQFLRDLDTR